MKEKKSLISEKLNLMLVDNGLISKKTLIDHMNKGGVIIAPQTVYNALSGKSVSINTLCIIADGLEIPLKYILSEDGPCASRYLYGEVEEKKQNYFNGTDANMISTNAFTRAILETWKNSSQSLRWLN